MQLAFQLADDSVFADLVVDCFGDHFTVELFHDIIMRINWRYYFLQNVVLSFLRCKLKQFLDSLASKKVIVPSFHVGLEHISSWISPIHLHYSLCLLLGKAVELPARDETLEQALSLELRKELSHHFWLRHFGLSTF